MRKIGNILWGIVLISIGIIISINALGLANINIFFSGWWTLFIIVPCFIGLFYDKDKTGNLIGLVIGILLLLSAQGLLQLRLILKLIIPIILVIVGLSFIFKDVLNRKVIGKIKKLNKDGLDEYYATFAGEEFNLSGDEFKGANLNAVFGGIKFNMKNAIITSEQILNASAIFGGVEIIAPANVNVKVKSTSLFGGVSNKASNITGENIPSLYINSFCLFGGVEIK